MEKNPLLNNKLNLKEIDFEADIFKDHKNLSNILSLKKIENYLNFVNEKNKNRGLYLVYLIWKFKTLKYNEIELLWNHKNSTSNKACYLSLLLKANIEKRYIKRAIELDEKHYSVCVKFYNHMNEPKEKLPKGIFFNWISDKVNFSILMHQRILYKVINKFQWEDYLSPREIMKIITYKFYQNNNFHLVDLLVVENKKRIGIEIELSLKTIATASFIYQDLIKNLRANNYDEIYVYCLSIKVFNRWTKLIKDQENFNKELEILNQDQDIKNRIKIFRIDTDINILEETGN